MVPAEEFALTGEALVSERCITVGTRDTTSVPRSLKDVQQEAVIDGQLAAGTDDHHLHLLLSSLSLSLSLQDAYYSIIPPISAAMNDILVEESVGFFTVREC